MANNQNWEQAQNILAVRLDTIGDVLMTTPALRALKTGQPGRRLTLLTSPPGAAIAGLVPEIDEIIVYEAPWLKATALRPNSQPEYAMIERLRREKFDAAVIFTVYSQNPLPSAFLCYMAGIPLRLAHCRENPYQLLTDWVSEPEPQNFIRHEVQRQLDLAASVGSHTTDQQLSLQVPPAARQFIQSRLKDLGLDLARPWAVMHPGATAPSRRYPPESFAAVANQLAEKHGWQIALTGSGEEKALVEQIRAAMKASSYTLVDQLGLAEMAALLEIVPLLIANNTGPVHMAAALGTPVVDLYALTNPQHTPWQVPHRVLNHDVPCKYCYKSICPAGHHHCLRLVTPDQVVTAALELYQETSEINHRKERLLLSSPM